MIPDTDTSANEAVFALEQLYCHFVHFYKPARWFVWLLNMEHIKCCFGTRG